MKRMWAPVSISIALLLMTGCASGAETLSSEEFWTGIQINGLEVDPPEDVEELVDQSELVVTGTIVDVTRGPVEEAGFDEYAPIAQLSVKVDQVLAGETGESTLKVIVARQELVSVEELAESIPKVPITMFLMDAGYADYYSPSARIGIVAENGDGTLETVRDPESSDVLTREVGTQAELEELVENLAG